MLNKAERPIHFEEYLGAASAPLPPKYRPRQRHKTVLHQVVREHLQTLLAEASLRSDTGRGYPLFIEREQAIGGSTEGADGVGGPAATGRGAEREDQKLRVGCKVSRVASFAGGVASEVSCHTLSDKEPFDRVLSHVLAATARGLFVASDWQKTEEGWRKAVAGRPNLPDPPEPWSRADKDEEGEVKERVQQKKLKIGVRGAGSRLRPGESVGSSNRVFKIPADISGSPHIRPLARGAALRGEGARRGRRGSTGRALPREAPAGAVSPVVP